MRTKSSPVRANTVARVPLDARVNASTLSKDRFKGVPSRFSVGVATVPGSSFYAHPELGRTKIRFCFPKTDDMLRDAGERLLKLEP